MPRLSRGDGRRAGPRLSGRLAAAQDGELVVVVREPEAVLVEAADVLEVPQLRALGEGLDRDDDLTPEPLALARDRLVRDDVELAEGDDHWE